MSYHIPKIDNFEASEPTMPLDVRVGDRVAVTWCEAHEVVGIEPAPSGGVYIDLYAPSGGGEYRIHRKRTALPIVKD